MIITINDHYNKSLLIMISKTVPYHIIFINDNIFIDTYYAKYIKLKTSYFDKIQFLFKVILIFFLKSIIPNVLSFIPPILFVKMLCSICYFNSIYKKIFKIYQV